MKKTSSWLTIDTEELNRTMEKVKDISSRSQYDIIVKHTINDLAKHINKSARTAIAKSYEAKASRIKKSFQPYQIRGEGSHDISCIIPIKDTRIKFSNSSGDFKVVLKRGRKRKKERIPPKGKVIRGATTILPHRPGSKRIHFYIPAGSLKGHIFARLNDGRRWQGVRRERVDGALEVKGKKQRVGSIVHGVGIGVPQMPINRSADEIQDDALAYAEQRIEHYYEQVVITGKIKR